MPAVPVHLPPRHRLPSGAGVDGGSPDGRQSGDGPESAAGGAEESSGPRREDGGQTYADFVKNRRLTFYHWFAGPPQFGLGEAVVAEATSRGMSAEHVSVDRLRGGEDLTAREPAESHIQAAKEGRVDGAHAGFPCSSFSRLRFREVPGLPGPVRDAQHLMGYPWNGPAAAAEAERGNLMVDRSMEFLSTVRDSARERGLPPVATCENPLPAPEDHLPSAFFMPTVQAFLDDDETEFGEFNSCIYGVPIWKPERWAGCL